MKKALLGSLLVVVLVGCNSSWMHNGTAENGSERSSEMSENMNEEMNGDMSSGMHDSMNNMMMLMEMQENMNGMLMSPVTHEKMAKAHQEMAACLKSKTDKQLCIAMMRESIGKMIRIKI